MRMEHPRLSIIVPVYNTAVFLPRCLESVIGQTYRNIEIICVDDGSTDDSLAVLQQYAAQDSRIKVLHQENAGVSAARNAGLATATGELVTFVDGDDWLEPDCYERATAAMTGEVDLVCFGMSIDGDIDAVSRREKEDYYRIRYAGVLECGMMEILSTDASSSNKVYRKRLLEQWHLRYVEGMAYGEDAAFYVCYAVIVRKTCYLPEKLYHYVQHDTSAMAVSSRKNERCIDHLLIVRHVLSFFRLLRLPANCLNLPDMVFTKFYTFAAVHTPPEMRGEVDKEAYLIGKEFKALGNVRSSFIRALLAEKQGGLERLCHWYTDNRECFGICGRSLYSITYEKNCNIYRLLGRVVKTVPMAEPT